MLSNTFWVRLPATKNSQILNFIRIWKHHVDEKMHSFSFRYRYLLIISTYKCTNYDSYMHMNDTAHIHSIHMLTDVIPWMQTLHLAHALQGSNTIITFSAFNFWFAKKDGKHLLFKVDEIITTAELRVLNVIYIYNISHPSIYPSISGVKMFRSLLAPNPEIPRTFWHQRCHASAETTAR